jgi:leader peptidase (prepilin peptidase)/N-methyltransferase
MTNVLEIALAGLVGAAVGSFLNVCIYRLPRGLSVVRPSSACPQCQRPLSWVENVPILSYLVLRGRCRTCQTSIGGIYPVVELVTALMFASAWWHYGPGPLLVSRVVLGCALIVLFAVDLEHRLLPNAVTLPGILVGFGLSFVAEPGPAASLTGILIGGGMLYTLAEAYYWFRREEGLGMGDVKMLAMVGAFIGWKLTLVTLMMASFFGSAVGLSLIALRLGDMKYALPFGTFLAMGAVLAVTVGPGLIDWYVAYW